MSYPGRPVPPIVGALAMTLALAGTGHAQAIRGQITRATDRSPISDALVVLLDSADREVRRASTLASGAFVMRSLQSGSYRIRVLRIGFAPWESEGVEVGPAGQEMNLGLIVSDDPVLLPEDIVVQASGSCRSIGDGTATTALLMEEAKKAFALVEETIGGHNLRFRSSSWLRTVDRAGKVVDERIQGSELRDWPIESAPVDSLSQWGFVRPPTRLEEASGLGPKYFGPDGAVLFSPWFLKRHCFSLSRSPDDSSLVGLTFRPLEGAEQPDIEGTLWLFQNSLILDHLEFRYVGLPRWVPQGTARGRLDFATLPMGGWVVSRWQIRAPLEKRELGSGASKVGGFLESGGRVTEATGRSGESLWVFDN